MTKRQLGIRVSNSLRKRLDCYAKEEKTSNTEVAISQLAAQLPEIASKN